MFKLPEPHGFLPFASKALCTRCQRIVVPVPILNICPHCGRPVVKLTM